MQTTFGPNTSNPFDQSKQTASSGWPSVTPSSDQQHLHQPFGAPGLAPSFGMYPPPGLSAAAGGGFPPYPLHGMLANHPAGGSATAANTGTANASAMPPVYPYASHLHHHHHAAQMHAAMASAYNPYGPFPPPPGGMAWPGAMPPFPFGAGAYGAVPPTATASFPPPSGGLSTFSYPSSPTPTPTSGGGSRGAQRSQTDGDNSNSSSGDNGGSGSGGGGSGDSRKPAKGGQQRHRPGGGGESSEGRGFDLSASNSAVSESRQLIVKFLTDQTSERQFCTLFEQHGPIDNARIIYDRKTGHTKGFGFITYANPADAVKALRTMGGYPLHGRQLNVALVQTERRRAFAAHEFSAD